MAHAQTPARQNALHPTFAAILGNIEGQAQQLKRTEFVTGMARMDWEFEYGDDRRVYREGVATLAALRRDQLDIDPAGLLWNKHAPAYYRTDRRLKVAVQSASGAYESTWVVTDLPIVDVARHFMQRNEGARVEVSAVAREGA